MTGDVPAEPGTGADVPPSAVVRVDHGVWLVRGLSEARRILARDAAFRPAHPREFVPGLSRSFFMATDTGTPQDRARYRAALASAISPQRIDRFTDRVLGPTARRLAAQLPGDQAFDVMDDYVRPYSRQTSYALAGIEPAVAADLSARLRVASELLPTDEGRRAGLTLLAEVRAAIRDLAARGALDAESLPMHAVHHGLLTVEEIPLITVPILEMAALDMSGALTQQTLHAVAHLPPARQRLLATPARSRAAAEEAARRLRDIYVTRVATTRTVLSGEVVEQGDRLVIDVHAANADPRSFPDTSFAPGRDIAHLAFGHGTHLCMGRALALVTAAVGVGALVRRGTLAPATQDRFLVLHS